MLIEIKRIYKSGFERHILVNTDYVVKIEEVADDDHLHPEIKTRFVMDSMSHDGPDVLYCSYDHDYIKGILTKKRNKR